MVSREGLLILRQFTGQGQSVVIEPSIMILLSKKDPLFSQYSKKWPNKFLLLVRATMLHVLALEGKSVLVSE
jgi:hypothetical protein